MADESKSLYDYGIASTDPGIEFPVEFYDRTSLGLSNLLMRGDVDAMSRSLLSPQTLTPVEMRTFRSYITRGKKPNKVLATILDTVTNPLFLIGLFASTKFPIMKVSELREALLGARAGVKPVGAAMSYIHSAFGNLRHLPGMIERIGAFLGDQFRFAYKYGRDLRKAATVVGKMTETEAVAGTYLSQGFNVANPGKNTAAHQVMKLIGWTAEDGPLMPGLQGQLRPEVIKYGGAIKKIMSRAAKRVGLDRASGTAARVLHELGLKGVEIGEYIEDYWSRFIKMDFYGSVGMRRTINSKGRGFLTTKAVKEKVASSLKARTKGILTMPDPQEAALVEHLWNPKAYTKLGEYLAGNKSRFIDRLTASLETGLAESKPAAWKKDLLKWMRKEFRVSLKSRISPVKEVRRNTLEFIRERLVAAQKAGPAKLAQEIEEVANVYANLPTYSMNGLTVPPRYITALGNTYAWHVKGHGNELLKSAKTAKFGWDRDYIYNSLFPHLRGTMSETQYNWYTLFGEQKESIRRWLKYHPMFKSIPPKLHEWLQKPFQPNTAGLGYHTTMGGISEWFYLSTLGLPNLSPTFVNTLQPWITTVNMIGVKGMKMGYEDAIPRWKNFLGYLSKGMSKEEALRKAAPEFVKYTRDTGNLLDQLRAGDLLASAGTGAKAASAWGKIKDMLLAPFSAVETLHNRLVSFYGTYQKGLSEGMAAKQAGGAGAAMVLHTQFGGGILGMPRAIMNLPVPIRQFAYFPLRFLGFIHNSVRMGADPSKLDWGTIGRALMGSTAAYYGAKDLLGVDISRGLIWGALPGPTFEGAPFFPAPYMPPLGSVAGSVLQALATGEAKPLGAAAALLTPGGIGLRRMYKTFAPRYADYQNRTEDGRIPVYGANRALVGTYTPFEMFLKSVGITPTSYAGEYGAAKWLLTQREQIRTYRREYLEALSQNNLTKAEKIGEEFKDRYPELGPLSVRKTDLQAVQNRHEVSRLNRIIKGFPAASRPLFEQVASQAMMQRVFEDIQAAPDSRDWYTQAIAAQQ